MIFKNSKRRQPQRGATNLLYPVIQALRMLAVVTAIACSTSRPGLGRITRSGDFWRRHRAGHLDQARAWLDEGLDPNQLADRIGSGLMIGAWEGNIPIMDLFSFPRRRFRTRPTASASRPYNWLPGRGHLEAVRWLLDRGVGVNRNGNYWSALHYAVFAGHREIAALTDGTWRQCERAGAERCIGPDDGGTRRP